MTTGCHQAPLRRLTIAIASLIRYSESISRWSSGPSFALAAFADGAASPGLPLPLGRRRPAWGWPQRNLVTFYSKAEEVSMSILWDKASQSALALAWTPKKWSSIQPPPKNKVVLIREIFGIDGQSIGLFHNRLFHSIKPGENVKKASSLPVTVISS